MHETTLLEWAEAYLRHRDLFEKRIASLEKSADGFLIKGKDGAQTRCLAPEQLEAGVLDRADTGGVLIVTRNTKANLEFLIKHWKRLAAMPALKLILVNVTKHEKWVIVPYSHDAIAEPESLALGLRAMFEAVPEG